MLHVVKIGGKLIEDEFLLDTFLKNFHKLRGSKILIHGGGKYASILSKRLGLYPKIVKGRRITNMKTLEVLIMSYAGLLNKALVASLEKLGTSTLGLSGADGNLIQSIRRYVKSIDYGHVGDFNKESVNIKDLYSLIQLNYVPVFCAITHDAKGHLLNTNADTIASYIAISMKEIEEICLHYCFEKRGILRNLEDANSYYTKINFDNFYKFRIFYQGMIPKLENAFYALKKGVRKVNILHPSSLFCRRKDKTLLYL
ncbi:acetylglutamate kinase [Candidatus Uzinura diaspidicola str. ASNER]|uniref:Acetylglutamate kinase n=1 Tax=Candidatus Uzinura diaspidicola str. ASNER TaxID=1133592 RepID=L7VG90_9FLAO|nr:acetylglutamate kinase [Candidatus Uzinura diaspidicola str. ASNER]